MPTSSDPLLAEWSRRFLAELHHRPDLRRLGLLIATEDQSRFWPFPELSDLDDLATFLDDELAAVQELEPEVVALVLPVSPTPEAGFPDRDYDLLVVAVDSARHCAVLLGAVVGQEDETVLGWRDLTAQHGYIPKLAPKLFRAFKSLAAPRPDEVDEWALVEARAHQTPSLERLLIACLEERAYRFGGEPAKELAAALELWPTGSAWEAVLAEAELLEARYRGYEAELEEPFDAVLATQDDPTTGLLLYAALVELARRDSFDRGRLLNVVNEADWTARKDALGYLGERSATTPLPSP